MLRSDGNKQSKVGLIACGVVATGASVIWIGYGLSESAKYQSEANAKAAENARYIRQHIAQACVGPSEIERIRCIYEAKNAQREFDYNQSDLVAQRQSALWAFIMGAAAVIGMVISAVGVWLVKITFDETRRSNEIAFNEAEAAAKLAAETRSAAILAERAFIKVQGCVVIPPDPETPKALKCILKIANNGRSAARVVGIDYRVENQPVFSKFSRRKHRMNMNVLAGYAAECSPFNVHHRKKYPLFLCGNIKYETIYNSNFETYFCFKIEGPLERTSLGGYANEFWQPIQHRDMPADT